MNELAQSWVIEVLGAREVNDIRSLAFGITSNLRVIEADGTSFVLRRYENDEVIDFHPNVVENEARALTAARPALGEVVPELIAVDVTGAQAGRPSLLMTFRPGRPVIHGTDTRKMVSPLSRLHAGPLPDGLPRYHHWFDVDRVVVPTWTTAPHAWSKLIDSLRGAEPEAPHVFLHRDYHPGNLLWNDGRLSGIVDWAFSCRGPRGIDVAHTRWNLALVDGVAAADRFLDDYRELVPGYHHHLWWDVANLFSADDQFAGVIAFNAFGSHLDVELLRSRSDDWAAALASTA